MKNTGGSNPIGILWETLRYHADRILSNPELPLVGGGIRKHMIQETAPNSKQRPYDYTLLGQRRKYGDYTNLSQGQQIVEKLLEPKRKRRRDSSGEESSSSSDDDKPKKPKRMKQIGFMAGVTRRTVEIQLPIYITRDRTFDRWYFNFIPSTTSIVSSYYLLNNIYSPVPKDGTWPQDGTCPELQLLNRSYRHIKIEGINYEFFNDCVLYEIDTMTIPLLSISVTPDKHPLYTNNDIKFIKDNYIYDNNIYQQTINTDQKFNDIQYSIPQYTVQDVDKSSIGSWQNLATLNECKMSLNIGQGTVSRSGPIFPIGEDDQFDYCRIGVVSVTLTCAFATPQGEILTFT